MSTATTIPEKIGEFLESSKEYVESRVELEILKGTGKLANGMSLFIRFILVLSVAILILLLICIGFAGLINQAMDSPVAGYFIMAAAMLFALVLTVLLGKKQLQKSITNAILNNIDHD